MTNNILIQNDQGRQSPHRSLLVRIPYGEANARRMNDLARVFGEDTRTIRKRIERARLAGNVIAGTGAGYFVPCSEDELRRYVHTGTERIATAIACLAPAVHLLEELEAQKEDSRDDQNE